MSREVQREKTREKKKKIAYFDYNLLFLVIFLLSFGLVMLYSSSAYISFLLINMGMMHII